MDQKAQRQMLYVGLIFGLCARLAENNVIYMGYLSASTCIEVVELRAYDEAPEVTMSGHTVTWTFIEGGAEVGIDGQKFILVKREAV